MQAISYALWTVYIKNIVHSAITLVILILDTVVSQQEFMNFMN
jgi:hypothetical protein